MRQNGGPPWDFNGSQWFSRNPNKSQWISIKTIVESILRIQSINNTEIIKYIESEEIKLDGSKGLSLNYKKGSNQLRQTILLTSSNNWVTSTIPLEEFKDSKNNLDTIGINFKQTQCSKVN